MEEKKEKIELSPEEQAKMDNIKKEAVQADYENKLKELAEFQHNVMVQDEELLRIAREKESFEKLSKIIVDNYGKPFEKCEWNWEKKPEYWEEKKVQEQISIERKMTEFDLKKRNTERVRENIIDQIESLEKSIEMMEENELKD